jgi:hypothetical protein
VFISVHSIMKSTNACDLIVMRLQNSSEYGLSSNAYLMMRPLASLLCKISPSGNSMTTSMGVSVKIMVQFARGNQDGIEQLLDQRVIGLRLIEYIADELY